MYVIKKGFLYLAETVINSAYTRNLRYARFFESDEAAEREKCDNEIVVVINADELCRRKENPQYEH